LNEACQLHVEDVAVEKGIPCLVVSELQSDGGSSMKRLKNQASRRVVPIHSILLRTGFVQFAESRRKQGGSPQLFSELSAGKSGRYSNPFSKWFGRYLTSLFGEKPRATFHSLRHNFRDALRDGGVGIEAVERLGGWRRKHASQEREYGQGLSIKRLRQEI